MKFPVVILAAFTATLLLRADERGASSLPTSIQEMRATEFTSEQYYEAPNDQKLKLRFSGGSVAPLPGGLQEITDIRIEYFGVGGSTRMRAESPRCEMSPFDQVASSTNKLSLQSGDAKMRTDGVGYVWRQNETNGMILTLTNPVTVLKMGTNSFFKL